MESEGQKQATLGHPEAGLPNKRAFHAAERREGGSEPSGALYRRRQAFKGLRPSALASWVIAEWFQQVASAAKE